MPHVKPSGLKLLRGVRQVASRQPPARQVLTMRACIAVDEMLSEKALEGVDSKPTLRGPDNLRAVHPTSQLAWMSHGITSKSVDLRT